MPLYAVFYKDRDEWYFSKAFVNKSDAMHHVRGLPWALRRAEQKIVSYQPV